MNALVSRRALLGAVPSLAAPMALLPASVAQAASESPIFALLREWQSIKDRLDNPAWKGSEEESERLFQIWIRLEEQIAAEPVTCAADLAAKLVMLDEFSECDLARTIEAECRALVDERVGQ